MITLKWESVDGEKTVIGQAPDRPNGWLEIAIAGVSHREYKHKSELYDTMINDTKRFKEQQLFQKEEFEKQILINNELSEYRNDYGFTEKMSPLQKGRVLKILNKQFSDSDFSVKPLKDIIYDRVKDGWKLEYNDIDGRIFTKNDMVLTEQTIHKTGMDYAEYLLLML